MNCIMVSRLERALHVIFSMKMMSEKYMEGLKEVHIISVDLEKAYNILVCNVDE